MEVLAGEPNLETEVKQHRARFSLDFSKVSMPIQPGDVSADVKHHKARDMQSLALP